MQIFLSDCTRLNSLGHNAGLFSSQAIIMEWSVPVDAAAVVDLENSLAIGPMNADGTYRLYEVTVGRINGLKVEIFANEHPPPHFRVSIQARATLSRSALSLQCMGTR